MSFRVLFYSVIDRRERGGAQMVVGRLIDRLRGRGHRIIEAWGGPAAQPVAEEWMCPLHVRPLPRTPTHWARPYHVPSLARVITGLAARRPRIVNVHFISEQSLYFLRLSKVMGFKTVLSAHGSDILVPGPMMRDFLPRFLRDADAVTVVSRHLRDAVLRYEGVDPAKVYVIPNGIDCAFWTPDRAEEQERQPEPPTVVAVGRLDPVKGYDGLLTAFAAVHCATPQARLCIIGDGPMAAALHGQVRALGLEGAVDLPGRLGAEEVRAQLRTAAAYVLSSRSEGMPLALLEAMACGAPCVATGVGGVPEVLTPRTGLVVPPDAPVPLAEALMLLLRDRDLARGLGARAHQRAQAFSSAACDRAYEAVYGAVDGERHV